MDGQIILKVVCHDIRTIFSVTCDITAPTRLKSRTEFSIIGVEFLSSGCGYVACDTNLPKIALIS